MTIQKLSPYGLLFLSLILSFLISGKAQAQIDPGFCAREHPEEPYCHVMMSLIGGHLNQLGVGVPMASLPERLASRLQGHFPGLDLAAIRVGFSDRQPVGNATTDCNNIYFHDRYVLTEIQSMLFSEQDDFYWLLHELAHSQQCAQLGQDEFRFRWMQAARGFVWRNPIDLLIGRLDWHDLWLAVPLEQEADEHAWKGLSIVKGFHRSVVTGDTDGDGREEIGSFEPRIGRWRAIQGGNWAALGTHGQVGDIGLIADVDNDGTDDFITYTPGTGRWIAKNRNGTTLRTLTFGRGEYMPFTGDFDGDGTTDFAIYKAATREWWIRSGLNGFIVNRQLNGLLGATALVGDYDGDGATDFVNYANTNGFWSPRRADRRLIFLPRWGSRNAYLPLAAELDANVGSEMVLYRLDTAGFYGRTPDALLFSNDTSTWTNRRLQPFAADTNGDGRDELYVYFGRTNIVQLVR
ncbi:hypothetical protein SAMN02745866_01049 [Alteromonadaceae bacterium Bs31]|nr:hypothetical protein SAMN02745866_01049 [Alteromonadaceae bacterium Bs31]